MARWGRQGDFGVGLVKRLPGADLAHGRRDVRGRAVKFWAASRAQAERRGRVAAAAAAAASTTTTTLIEIAPRCHECAVYLRILILF